MISVASGLGATTQVQQSTTIVSSSFTSSSFSATTVAVAATTAVVSHVVAPVAVIDSTHDEILLAEARSLETLKGNPTALFKIFGSSGSMSTPDMLYISETQNDRNPKWLPVSGYWFIPLLRTSPSQQLLIEVWDENLLGVETLIGKCQCAVSDLTRQSGHGIVSSEDGKLRGSIFFTVSRWSEVGQSHSHSLAANSKNLEREKAGETAWFSPPINVKEAVEGDSWVSINIQGFVKIRFFDRVFTFDVLAIISNLIISFVILFVTWLVLGKSMEPGGSVFSPIITVFAGSVLGIGFARITGVPPLVGMLLAGILWGNTTAFASGTTSSLASFLRNIAVAVILSRAGLTFKWELTKPVLKNVALMSCIPQLSECITHAIVAYQLFPYPNFAMALYQGAAIASCSTAIVIPGVVDMQSKGYSITRGPNILMLCSIALDSVFAIWFTSFVIEFAFPNPVSEVPVWIRIVSAPVQILGGALCGVLFGAIEHWVYGHLYERIRDADDLNKKSVESSVRTKCLTMSVASGIGFIFGSYKLGVPGSGTVAVVAKAGFIAYRWGISPELDERRNALYHDVADLWDKFIVPGLFTIVGASIDLSAFADINLLLRALVCILVGLVVKGCFCFVVTKGIGYSKKEKLFLAIGWCAKSTVQAATAGKALVLAQALEPGNDPDKIAFAESALVAAKMINLIVVSSIALCAVGAGVGMSTLGPKLLQRESVAKDQAKKGH
jgi:NhaP-type Na+/H+ or K+/H+ antiporter